MSKALQCDRCGKYFGFDVQSFRCRFSNPKIYVFDGEKSFTFSGVIFKSEYEEYLDLCPECTKAFCVFMNQDIPYFMKEGDNNEEDHMPEMRNGDV